jgi:hypothetical protein
MAKSWQLASHGSFSILRPSRERLVSHSGGTYVGT